MSPGSPSQGSGSMVCFAHRWEAGEQLAQAVRMELQQRPVPESSAFVVYALPRGGVMVADPIAQQLGCPLDVIVAKKITRPENPELALGAVTSDGHVLWLPRARSTQPIPSHLYEIALHEARAKAFSQWQQLLPYRPHVNPAGAIALLVDDGIATGMTMAVAIQALKTLNPAEIWICAPVAPPEILPPLRSWGSSDKGTDPPLRIIILATPKPFNNVSRFYKTFPQVEIESVIQCLMRNAEETQPGFERNCDESQR